MKDKILNQIRNEKEILSICIQSLEKVTNNISKEEDIIYKKVYNKRYNGNLKIIPFYKDIIRII